MLPAQHKTLIGKWTRKYSQKRGNENSVHNPTKLNGEIAQGNIYNYKRNSTTWLSTSFIRKVAKTTVNLKLCTRGTQPTSQTPCIPINTLPYWHHPSSKSNLCLPKPVKPRLPMTWYHLLNITGESEILVSPFESRSR